MLPDRRQPQITHRPQSLKIAPCQLARATPSFNSELLPVGLENLFHKPFAPQRHPVREITHPAANQFPDRQLPVPLQDLPHPLGSDSSTPRLPIRESGGQVHYYPTTCLANCLALFRPDRTFSIRLLLRQRPPPATRSPLSMPQAAGNPGQQSRAGERPRSCPPYPWGTRSSGPTIPRVIETPASPTPATSASPVCYPIGVSLKSRIVRSP